MLDQHDQSDHRRRHRHMFDLLPESRRPARNRGKKHYHVLDLPPQISDISPSSMAKPSTTPIEKTFQRLHAGQNDQKKPPWLKRQSVILSALLDPNAQHTFRECIPTSLIYLPTHQASQPLQRQNPVRSLSKRRSHAFPLVKTPNQSPTPKRQTVKAPILVLA